MLQLRIGKGASVLDSKTIRGIMWPTSTVGSRVSRSLMDENSLSQSLLAGPHQPSTKLAEVPYPPNDAGRRSEELHGRDGDTQRARSC
jgi:hypothetical protein